MRTLCRFAYIEFANKESVDTASTLDRTLFRGRQLQVCDVTLLAKILRSALV